jgi:hypothetical protein
VRRTVRPSAERDQPDEHVDEPGGAAQRQDDGGEGQRRPARRLDRQQEALPGIPVDDGRGERNRRDDGTHPDHAENADGRQAPLLVEVDGERDEGSPVRREVAAPGEQEGLQPRTPQNLAEHRQAHEQHAHRPTLARPARVVNEGAREAQRRGSPPSTGNLEVRTGVRTPRARSRNPLQRAASRPTTNRIELRKERYCRDNLYAHLYAHVAVTTGNNAARSAVALAKPLEDGVMTGHAAAGRQYDSP